MATHKGKSKVSLDNPMLPLVINLDELPLIDIKFKIIETNCEFELDELHNWPFKKYEDANDRFSFWEPFLP